MKKKTFIVQILDSKKPSRTSFTQVEDALFYSNDTDAYLVFLPHEQEGFEFNEATVALYNTNDESLVERPAVIETFEGRKSVVLKMTEDILAHWGRWQAQVVFKQGNKINTSVVVRFDTLRYMLDQRPPTLRDVIKLDELYSQLVTVMDEIAGKDVISAPEIIMARGGENTLGERLDKEHNEVTAQLAQTEQELKQKPNRNETGWADLNTFDETTRSIIQGLEPGEINAVLGERNVMPFNTTFFKHGKNLFNKDVAKQGFYVNQNNGGLVSNASYTASDYMDVKEGSSYYFTGSVNDRIAFYDKDYNFISGMSSPQVPVVVPAGASKAVISFENRFLDAMQFEEGSQSTEHEPFSGWFLDSSVMKDGSILADKLGKLGTEVFNDNSLTPEKMTFFKGSKNLYNKLTSTPNRSISVASGNLATNADSITSDFIRVESGEYYSLSPHNPVIRLAFYDSHKSFVSGVSDPTNPILVPENATFVRYSYGGDFEDVRQFEKGQSVTSYEPYYESAFDVETIRDYSIPSSKIKGGVASGSSSVNADEIIVDMNQTNVTFYIKGSNPDSDRYLKYSFKKEEREFDETRSNGNLNAWRLVDLFEVERMVDFTFTDVYPESLMTNGVWEFALKEKGQPQFMGGSHGNEVMTDVFMLVDGIQKELGTIEKFKCNSIQFTQKSTIYRVFTQEPVANTIKSYDINAKDGIKITGEFDWTESIVLEGGSFFPMLPIKRTLTDNETQVTDRFVRDSDYDIKDISTTSSVVSSGASEALTDVDESSMWGQDSGISVKITSLKKAKEEEAMYIAASDLYNKFYYQIVGRSDYTVDVGENMKSTALFKFNTIN